MKKLELECKFFQISINFKEETAFWHTHNVEFKVESDQNDLIGYFKTWKDDVEPDMIKEAWKKLEEKTESFALGLQFIGNRRVYWKQIGLYYYFNGEKFSIRADIDIEAIIRRSKGEEFNYGYSVLPGLISGGESHADPVSLPQQMPIVPLDLKRHILTIIQAEELDGLKDNYEDEQLKRWFQILEELEDNKDSVDYKDIKYARNFVSHSLCHKEETIEFLERELPTSVYLNRSGQKEAGFRRDDSLHVALVSKYQNKARRLAKELVKQLIKDHGGYVE